MKFGKVRYNLAFINLTNLIKSLLGRLNLLVRSLTSIFFHIFDEDIATLLPQSTSKSTPEP